MALEALTGALFGSAMDDPIKNLSARFINSVQKRGIFAAKQGLANEAPEHYRKITGQDPPAETAGKYKLTKETNFNHAKVDTKNEILRAAIDNLDPIDFQKIYDKVEKVAAREQDRPKRTRSPTPGTLTRSPGTNATVDEITGKAVFGNSYQSPIDADQNTQRPTKKATPVPEQLVDDVKALQSRLSKAAEDEKPANPPSPPTAVAPAPPEENYHVEQTDKLRIDESKYDPSAAQVDPAGFVGGAASGVAQEVLSTLAKSAFPAASPFISMASGAYRAMNPDGQSAAMGREFSRSYAQYLAGNLFTAPDLALNRLSTVDANHAVSPFVQDLLLNVQPRNNQVRLYQQNFLAEQRAAMPFPI